MGQLWNVFQGNGYHNQFSTTRCLGNRYSRRARFSGQTRKRFRASRVGHVDFMPEYAEAARKSAANISSSNNADLHVCSFTTPLDADSTLSMRTALIQSFSRRGFKPPTAHAANPVATSSYAGCKAFLLTFFATFASTTGPCVSAVGSGGASPMRFE